MQGAHNLNHATQLGVCCNLHNSCIAVCSLVYNYVGLGQ